MRKEMFYLLAIVSMIIGCTTTQKGASIGTITGAGIGGIIGHQSDHGGEGAAIGAAAGALGGYVVGEHMKGKFCPVDGEHFDDSDNFCPKHGVELKSRSE